MNYTANADQLTPAEAGPHHYVADASELGFPPGQWPAQLDTDLGNGRPFVRSEVEHYRGSVARVVYLQANGCVTLTVFND